MSRKKLEDSARYYAGLVQQREQSILTLKRAEAELLYDATVFAARASEEPGLTDPEIVLRIKELEAELTKTNEALEWSSKEMSRLGEERDAWRDVVNDGYFADPQTAREYLSGKEAHHRSHHTREDKFEAELKQTCEQLVHARDLITKIEADRNTIKFQLKTAHEENERVRKEFETVVYERDIMKTTQFQEQQVGKLNAQHASALSWYVQEMSRVVKERDELREDLRLQLEEVTGDRDKYKRLHIAASHQRDTYWQTLGITKSELDALKVRATEAEDKLRAACDALQAKLNEKEARDSKELDLAATLNHLFWGIGLEKDPPQKSNEDILSHARMLWNRSNESHAMWSHVTQTAKTLMSLCNQTDARAALDKHWGEGTVQAAIIKLRAALGL